jgi:glycosyltransferase involved in cell wall biosynthesis
VRIGFDARAIRYRGIGTYSRNLLRCFAGSGIEFVVFCQDQEKDAIPLSDSFTLVSANTDPLASLGRGAFRTLVEKSQVDLLHVPSPWAPTPLNVPLVSTIHDVTPLLYAGVDPAKARVIHNGVSEKFKPQTDPDVRMGVRHRYALPERFVFWVGDFRPEKNLLFLVQGWSRLQQRLPEPQALVLAGAQTGEFRKLKREVKRRGLEGSVLFPGFIRDDDLPAVYSAATAFVFPSLYEGFGLPPLEAMACGTPCVVSNSSSLPEVTGSAALLFNPTSLDSFEGCMVQLLTQPDLYEALRQNGLRQSALFPWAKAAEETLQVYRSISEETESSQRSLQ